MSESRLLPISPDRIDPDARKVIHRLHRFDYEAYVVGGCVRDLLLGERPKDFDIATSATPTEIRRMFRNCRVIGRRFRLAHIFFGPKIIETATFRRDPSATDLEEEATMGPPPEAHGAAEKTRARGDGPAASRATADPRSRPSAKADSKTNGELSPDDLMIRRDNVFGTAEEDARRRDFTINGLFYNPGNNRVIDFVGGLDDLERGVVRTIGDPDLRFREDPIRILRAIRFAAKFGLTIDPATYAALTARRREIQKCAPPRVLEDTYRLLRRGAARPSVGMLLQTGVLDVMFADLRRILGPKTVAQRYWGALEALDATTRRGDVHSNALLLAALLLPIVAHFTDPEEDLPPGDPSKGVDALIRDIRMELKIPRREIDRFRRIVLMVRRMRTPRRRRTRPTAILRREEFPDALGLLETVTAYWGDSDEILERWRQIAAEHPAPSPRSPKRRRRKRRRRTSGETPNTPLTS